MADTITELAYKKLYVKFPQRVPSEEKVKALSPHIVRVSYPRQKSARFCHIVLESQSVVPEVLKQLNKKEYKNGHLSVELPRKLKYIKNEQKPPIQEKSKTLKENKIGNKHKAKNKLSVDDNSIVPQTEEVESSRITAGKHVRRRSGKPAAGGGNDRRLWIKKLPFKTEDKDLVATFPGCIWAKVYRSKASKSSRAICKFTTAQQAAAVVADPSKHKFKGKEVVVELAKSQQLRGSGMKKKYGLKNENSVMDIAGETLKTESKVESETDTELKENENNGDESMDTDDDDDDDDSDDDDDGDDTLESGDSTGDLDVNSSENDD
ncbi:RNA-binding protein 28-like [Schistocerca piceifrons]|uniref:RNA-binding protein 28-like n=1 Tax=Schistocerca piceifrons TaxID=274613 RepID=UPI001F5F0972|nr:RNA-binding protein 28-like [Schistocerca piceifrons]XP_047108426.1 RNA-binding protein 28-like [Schistocerca piceifrons]